MRLGLMGDIHGNASALKAVLHAMTRSDVDSVFLTGDYIGYYYEPHIVLEMLAKLNACAICGNHEKMFLECLEDPTLLENYRLRYGSGLNIAIRLFKSSEIGYLKRLPEILMVEVDGKKLLIAHGAPWDNNCYLYPDAESRLWSRVADEGVDYVILGHTHHRMSKRVGNTFIINPGSVGQPRDKKPGAAWAILDTRTGLLEQRTETYDIDRLTNQVKSIDSELPYLWKVLTRA